ncbi:hypothetical protein [Fimbriiglobus ruber]|uniref:Uncharacterized protein n=1 Tax=Fimbriiglobus ruber TaxID=1908690 RepID=A0A225ED86_9BACT|nr:hypothetical protein [Fimbriiglobus ruber]OWK47279.1 hypothetical protein FRUB_00978 [Fimbriiglobus ruber]
MYRAYGLLLPSSDFTVDEAFRRLTVRFPQYSVLLGGNGQITVESDVWEIEVALVDGPHVLNESQGFAEHIAGVSELGNVASCDRRVEVWSDTPDAEMAHLKDFQDLIEVLKTFTGVIVVDPKERQLL